MAKGSDHLLNLTDVMPNTSKRVEDLIDKELSMAKTTVAKRTSSSYSSSTTNKDNDEKFAKKSDLEKFAKKSDLENFATRSNLSYWKDELRSEMKVQYDTLKKLIYELQHPQPTLFYPGTRTVKNRVVKALYRIFTLCDHDKDGALSDAEYNHYWVKCFGSGLSSSQIENVKRSVQEKFYDGVNDRGHLTLAGFFILHAQYISDGLLSKTWKVLRSFGYNDDIILRYDNYYVQLQQQQQQAVQNVLDVFNYAQTTVVHPLAPLFNQNTRMLKPLCARALKRIFILSDSDRDGVLSDRELHLHDMQPSEIAAVKKLVQERHPGEVTSRGFTLAGFLSLHALYIETVRPEKTWALLTSFGYGHDLKLRDDYLSFSFERAPDQSVELTDEAIGFLTWIFSSFDLDADGSLQPNELDDLFSTSPESPWDIALYKDAAGGTASGGLSLNGFLAKWSLMTLLEPAKSFAYLSYLCYRGASTSAFHITKERRVDRAEQKSERNVFQCFVFGPKKAGKSALLNSFLGRPFSESYASTPKERFAAKVVNLPEGDKKTLILREIPEDGVRHLLSNTKSLAACDVAIFLHDGSDEKLWKKAEKVLNDVASHAVRNSFGMPCLIVAAKSDLHCPYLMAMQDSVGVHWDMGIEPPLPICTKLGHLNSLFQRIINAAEHPHLNIPETEAGRSLKRDSDQVLDFLIRSSTSLFELLGKRRIFMCAGWIAAITVVVAVCSADFGREDASKAEKAYEVEEVMVSMGIHLEEPEFDALLKLSSEVGRED
ncbi:Mitochondrial rho gtpase [Thalictrum thalictroides]|uniref:Mitochondrial rho gtpase n=1 Tax=Thalictrum thalictroides TaxID=46969 RepID=A0A7J6X9U7_THATH|nr:Mitochondrial rho gtpase [Thalictrum thalictroides]